MANPEQNATLFEDLEGPAAAGQPKPAEVPCNLKLRRANRDQLKVTVQPPYRWRSERAG